ncbi:MAG: hypothetical protein NXI22_02110 [bacterium]|nr:hypothetical protein [bacterium]
MLTTTFLICAIVGGAILVLQFVMTLTGFSADSLGLEIPDSIDVELDADGIHSVSDSPDLHHDSSWFFGIISVRTVVAAIAFFGICGMIAHSSNLVSPLVEVVIAVIGGLVAMTVVFWLMLGVKTLAEDGTLQVHSAIGKVGKVYVPIPANQSALGKIQVQVQDRIEEFAAVTSSDVRLATGDRVKVVGMLGKSTLVVTPFVDEVVKEPVG